MAYPNPFKNELLAQVSLPVAGNISIAIFDVTGKQISNQTISGNDGVNTIKITDIEYLQSGVYFIQITAGNKTMMHKVVHQ